MEEILTKAEQKEYAIKALEKLAPLKAYVNAFKKDTITMYERFGGYYIDDYSEPALLQKIQEIESEYGGTIYAVTHELTEFGELYDLLYVSKYKEDAEFSIEEAGRGTFYVFAYVWNKTDDMCSEFGTIGIQSALGGLKRI